MVGREVSLVVDRGESNPASRSWTVEGLEVDDDRGHEAVDGVDFEVRAGEILGIAGVAGNGQDELVEALVGLRRPTSRPRPLDGNDITGQASARHLRARRGLCPGRPAIASGWSCRSRSPTTSC